MNTHYIHSAVAQDFVSGRACCVNQYHYESRKRRVVMWLAVHAAGKTWYKVLYQYTMYVISLSNISLNTNFKQIARVELKCAEYSEGDCILCRTSRYFFRSFTNVSLLYFVIHSNGMTSCQSSLIDWLIDWLVFNVQRAIFQLYSGRESSLTENVSCNVAPLLYHHSGVIQHLVSDTLYQTATFINFKGKGT